jgi:hypothetical protein
MAVDEHDIPKQQAPLLRNLVTLLVAKAQACWWSKHGCCGTMTSLYIMNKKHKENKSLEKKTLHLAICSI